MKRVGIFTYHFSDNYGALFQAYGLRKWLRDCGLAADFVNYHPAYVEEGGSVVQPWRLSLLRRNLVNLYLRLAHLRKLIFGNKLQRELFEAFRCEVLGVSGPRLRTASELEGEMLGYDILICGSDQIWNPSPQRGLDPVYFLNIPGSDHAYKIAYAPSFGRHKIEKEHDAELAKLVGAIDGISVREASGLEILAQAGIVRPDVPVVPDPTILLGDFSDLIDRSPPIENHVFCYALRTDEVIRDVAMSAGKALDAEVSSPRSGHQRWKDIGHGSSPGPIEWLQKLSSAQLVVSNSFHGVALSIVLNRPFIAVALPGKKARMNARIENLLNVTGLAERLVNASDAATIYHLTKTPIDWAAVNARVAKLRADAGHYLASEISRAQG